jgi:hypothetical protein
VVIVEQVGDAGQLDGVTPQPAYIHWMVDATRVMFDE